MVGQHPEGDRDALRPTTVGAIDELPLFGGEYFSLTEGPLSRSTAIVAWSPLG